jgi:hypothetical protein
MPSPYEGTVLYHTATLVAPHWTAEVRISGGVVISAIGPAGQAMGWELNQLIDWVQAKGWQLRFGGE